MADKHRASTLQVYKRSGNEETAIETTDPVAFFKNDVTRLRISGEWPNTPDYSKVNFIESVLIDIVAEDIDFSECDFKDSFLRNARFIRCTFNNGEFATVFAEHCLFEECTFYNFAGHNVDFYCTKFASCDLTNIIIKSSKFSDCLFVDCITSNRVCEISSLEATMFRRTEIQIETITSNFGLTVENLDNSKIRSGRPREEYRYLDQGDLQALISDKSLPAVERLRMEYFLKESLLAGSENLDEALDLRSWVTEYKNPGSFVELLDGFAEFIVSIYECEKVCIHTILLLHYITSTLTESVDMKSPRLHKISMALGGTHLILSRFAEEFFSAMECLDLEYDDHIRLLVSGPFSRTYFEQQLEPWLSDGAIEIVGLKRHNSPLELELLPLDSSAARAFVAALLATRTKKDLLKIKEEVLAHNRKLQLSGKTRTRKASAGRLVSKKESHEELVSILDNLTMDRSKEEFRIKVKSLLPGSILLDLKLDISTRLIGRLRDAFISFLLPPGRSLGF